MDCLPPINKENLLLSFVFGKSNDILFKKVISGVARAFPGGWVAHLESQNKEEN